MWRTRRSNSWLILSAGLALGLAIGGAMTAGVLLGRASHPAAGFPSLEELKLAAMATHGSDSFAVATGPIDENVEGLFTLDFLTGDLQCYVINNRTGTPGGFFKANVNNDLSVERGKKPSYLLVTGQFAFAATYSNQRPANTIVYVVDANTGDVACYTFPWTRAASNIPQGQSAPMNLVAKWKTRSVAVR
jgi:hypothetical protein